MKLDLKGRAALVTGASKGIGLATAVALSRSGVHVCLLSRSQQNLDAAKEQVRRESGSDPPTYCGNVADDKTCSGAIEAVMTRFGRLDILVNNAEGPPMGTFLEHSEEVWTAAYQLNLLAPIRFARAAAPIMKQQKWGRIINVTSFQAKEPTPTMVLSATMRAGLSAFSKAISTELAPMGVTVNTVCPSAVLTERMVNITRASASREGRSYEEILQSAQKNIPVGRFSRPEEIADLILFLASESASYITGTSIMIDGGLTKSVF